jgi:hypothetical protein
VLLRLVRMRGVDLDLFDFDYDLTWMGFFLGPDLSVYGRYGGRDATSAESRVSLAGLRHAMQAALATHRRKRPPAPPRPKVPRTVEQYPAARRLPAMSCIHCHQVYEVRRQALQAKGKWSTDELWAYPVPENVGITLDVDRGDRITAVAPGSPAERAGLRKGDHLTTLDTRPLASFGDAQYALHRAPARGKVAVTWQRDERPMRGELELRAGWRKTDISWRWSLRSLDPPPWVHGEDLPAGERRALGLGPKRLALVQGDFVSEPARQAGIRQGDVIVGVNGAMLEMTGRQFAAHVRLSFKVGERVTYNLLRNGKRVDVRIRLVGR